MPTVNEIIQDESVAHAVSLQQYSLGVVRKIIATLNRSDARLMVALAEALDRMPVESFTVERLESLLASVLEVNAAAYAKVAQELGQELKDLASYELNWQYQLFQTTIPAPVQVHFPIAQVTVEQAYAAAMSRPFQGRLLRDWASTIEADRLAKVRNAVRQGYMEGRTVAQIVSEIRGTRANNYADGFLQRPRKDLETVVRTAISHTAATARQEFTSANSDIIKAERWVSTLDTKTSAECRIRDQLQYTAETHKPIGHKIPWLQGPGKLHFNAVPAGSMIQTSCGAKPIEQVVVGDLVLTHTGAFKAVTDTRSKLNESGIIRTIRMESGRVLRATDDHPIFVSGKGWCFVGTVEVGDALFCNPEQPPEECSIAGAVVANTEDSPPITDQRSVALGRTLKLAAAGIDFEGDLHVGPGEIEDVVCRAVLEDPALIECQSRLHYLLALADLLSKHGSHALGELLTGLIADRPAAHPLRGARAEAGCLLSGERALNDAIHVDGIVGLHALGMGSMDGAGFLGHAECPVVLSGLGLASPAGEIGLGLLSLGANREIHDLGVAREGAIGESMLSLDGAKGQPVLDMLFQDELRVIRQRFRHDRVLALEVSDYNSMVYDLAVADSASYVCNGIVVSNCRSTSSPVTKSWRELGIPIDEMTPSQRASMDGQVPADQDYNQWLSKQSDARIEQVLGPERFKLYKSGGIKLDDFYSPTGQWYTIEQLQRRDEAAFSRIAA